MITTARRRRRFFLQLRPPLLLCVWLYCTTVVVCAFTPAPLGLGAIFLRPSGTKTRPSLGEDADLLKAADFFTDAFW
jgi:hypothetical protein